MSTLFTTPRLRVRGWREEDLPQLARILTDAQTMSHWPAPFDAAGVRGWLDRAIRHMREHGFARCCCQTLEGGRIVGDVGIMRLEILGAQRNDLGYIIHRDYWRQGYALEAAEGFVEWARRRQLDELVATMAVDNLPSAALARRLGMQQLEDFRNPNNQNKLTHYFRLPL